MRDQMSRRSAMGLALSAPLFCIAEERKYARMPWHLVDSWWDLGKDQPFESLAVDVSIGADIPGNVNLYIAPIGLGHLDKTPFYGGIQTRADGNTRRDPKLRVIGPGYLFSMWNERRLEAIRPADGGFLQSSGHEGDFVSVRRPHAWTKGKYTYRLCKMDRDEADGKPATWVGAFVHSHEKDENIFVGALRFPGENPRLGAKVANFVEIYGAKKPVSEIPRLEIVFGPPVVNGRKAAVVAADAVYPKGVPDVATTTAIDGNLVVRLGDELESRQARRVRLIPKQQP